MKNVVKPGRFGESGGGCGGQSREVSSHRGNYKIGADTVCYNCYNKGHLSYHCTLPKAKKTALRCTTSKGEFKQEKGFRRTHKPVVSCDGRFINELGR